MSGPTNATIPPDCRDDKHDFFYEIVDGVRRVRIPPPACDLALVSTLILELNTVAQKRHTGRAFSHILYALDEARGNYRRPAVAYVSSDRWTAAPLTEEESWSVVPDLTIDFVGIETVAEINRRLADYFAAGVRLAWCLDSQARRASVHEPAGQVSVLNEDDALDGQELLPGFELQLSNLFDSIRRPKKFDRPPTSGNY